MSSQYYPPYKSSSNNIKVELDLSNYAIKDDVKERMKLTKIKKKLFLLEDFFLMNIIVI